MFVNLEIKCFMASYSNFIPDTLLPSDVNPVDIFFEILGEHFEVFSRCRSRFV